MKLNLFLIFISIHFVTAQRITTIQLDGIQYFISRMNPYSPELNYFLAYQYCRSLGLQLVSFETKEKAETMVQYLKNAGYSKYDFWTSGNNLGTDMFLWMSTGLPFNATFDYMLKSDNNRSMDIPPGTEPQRVARESVDNRSIEGCVAMISPNLAWDALDCTLIKDFICEQTRCYYYNYGSIPVSATQGNRNRTFYFTSSATSMAESTTPIVTAANVTSFMPIKSNIPKNNKNDENTEIQNDQLNDDKNKKDSIIKQLMAPNLENNSRPEHIPDIASLFVKRPLNTDSVFAGLGTHEIRSILQISEPKQKVVFTEHDEVQPSNNVITEASTIGPYDLIGQDYQADESDSTMLEQQQQDDDTSTVLPQSESSYKYNIKVRSNGKVLDPASK